MQKLGGMGGVLGMLPGIGKAKSQLAGIDDKMIKRQHAIIMSMTRQERANPKIINGKRRRRIAAGSGTDVPEVNKLLKMHRQMADMMKQMGRNKGLMSRMFGGMGGMGGGMPEPTPEMIEQAKAAASSGKMPSGLPGMGGGAMPKGLPGLGTGLPGLGGGAMPPGLPGLPGAGVGAGKRKKKRK